MRAHSDQGGRGGIGRGLASPAPACGQDQTARHDEHGAATVVASTDVWGSVASAVARRPRDRQLDPDQRRRRPALLRGQPRRRRRHHRRLAGRLQRRRLRPLGRRCAGRPPRRRGRQRLLAAEQRRRSRPTSTSSTTWAPPRRSPTRIADRLAEVDPDHADDYRANAAEFGKQADTIAASERAIAQAHPGASVVATEPVAYYLLRNAGITDRTPAGFAAAVEEGDDPAPADVAAMLDLINSRQVSALVFNPQTETAATQADRGRRPAGFGSGRHGHRDAARGHRLPDLAAPDRRAVGEPVG